MSSGYGFVRLPVEDGKTRHQGSPQTKGDIYIGAEQAGDACTGDQVAVRILRAQRYGRHRGPEGEIVEVLARRTHRFVGTYFEVGDQGHVQIDGRDFPQAILVGDASARSARVNDKVVIEMVRFPTFQREGEGVVLEVLGRHNAPGVDTLSILHEFQLPQQFPEQVLQDARRQAERFDGSITGRRRDLTEETVVTIDPETARDFDDAISLRRLENGHWNLGVHIADVSHFVPARSALDREARERGTSVYLPDQVIPMLPEIISNNLASLQPKQVRYALSAILELTAKGAVVACDVIPTAVRSNRRFTYEEVDSYLADPDAWRKRLSRSVHQLLAEMHALAMLLRQRRFQRGALELHLPDIEVDLDSHGRVSGAHLEEHSESHQIIEEFMLLANEAVAERLEAAGVIFLRRVHGKPDPRKLKVLTEFVKDLGVSTESLQNRFAIQRLLADVQSKPECHAVNYAVLRAMQKAEYAPIDDGHYALASDCYCHFTSPIRRYPDLTVHRLLKALSQGKRPHQHYGRIAQLGDHCSEREQRAASAERELTRLKLLHFFAGKIGEEMEAIISGVEEYGIFAQGVELPVEGLIHVSTLDDDRYRYRRGSHTLQGQREGNTFRLGDRIWVEVARVDLPRRELDFRLVAKDSPQRTRRSRRVRKKKNRTHAKQSRRPGRRERRRRGS